MQICFSIFTKFLLVGGGKRIETVEVTLNKCVQCPGSCLTIAACSSCVFQNVSL